MQLLSVQHNHDVQENVTTHESYALADVLWIADPTGYDEDGVQKIKEYLVNDNKTVVITYNIQPEIYEEGSFGNADKVISQPFDTIKNVTKICTKLDLNMKPA